MVKHLEPSWEMHVVVSIENDGHVGFHMEMHVGFHPISIEHIENACINHMGWKSMGWLHKLIDVSSLQSPRSMMMVYLKKKHENR